MAKTFCEIQENVRQLDQLVAEIASASNEQSAGIPQINTAVTQMDKVTQNNAASASAELNAQGGQGFGPRNTGMPCSIWMDRCFVWLRQKGLLGTNAETK